MGLRRNNRARGFLIVLVVALSAGLLAGWIAADRVRDAQKRDRSDLNLFLEAASAGWAEATDQFFTVPESAAQSIGALSLETETTQERIDLLAETIRPARALDAAFLGYPDGSFVFVARSDEVSAGGFRTRVISVAGERRTVELTWTDAALTPLRSEIDEDDSYDPRERPWYITPVNDDQEMWTGPYVFASSQQPGITHSRSVLAPDGEQVAVVGIDMRLTELGEFLDELAPGRNGEALVVDDQGDVLAASSMDSATLQLDDVESALSADNTDALADSIERLASLPAMVARDRSADGRRTTVTRSARSSEDWYLAVQALDADFLASHDNASPRNVLRLLATALGVAFVAGSAGLWALRYRESLKEEAEQDELTGVLSRRALKRLLGVRLKDPKQMVAVAIVDLDRFKLVNDTHGHAAGDRVLTVVAGRIQAFADSHDAQAGRLGGDEFAIVAAADLDWMQLVLALIEPIKMGAVEFDVGASVGVALAVPGQHRGTEELLREADRALFDVKRSGGGAFEVSGRREPTDPANPSSAR